MLRLRRAGRDRSSPALATVPDAGIDTITANARRGGGRALAWIMLAAGPVLAVAITAARPTPPPAPISGGRGDGDGPAGWAEMYVRAWLSATADDDADLALFFPAGMSTDRPPGSQVPVDTATLSTHSTGPGVWSIVVAASVLTQGADGVRTVGLRCVQVPILEAGGAEHAISVGGARVLGYVAGALPSLVACPATLAPAALAYPGHAEVDSALGQSVLGFLAAYLTGRGGLERYLHPGAALSPVNPAPFTAVRISELRISQTLDRAQIGRPAENARARVFVRVDGIDGLGRATPMDYALSVVARAGRWETAAIDPVPQWGAAPSPAAITSAPLATTTVPPGPAPAVPGSTPPTAGTR